MNEEILKLKKRKQKLLEAIEFTKQKKKQVFEIVQKLASKVSSKLITRHQYEEELKKALKNRTAGQWIKYYDDYLDYYNYQVKLCDKLIKEEKYGRIKETARKKAVPALKISIIIVFIALMFSLVFILRPVGMNVFSKIGEKVSATINQLTEKAQPAPEEVLEVPAVAPSEFIEPTVPIVLENEQASIEEESLIQYPAILGKPVKWKKQFTVSSITGFSVELPRGSENIGVNAIEDGERRDITNIADINKKEVFFIFGERAVEVNINTNSITGNAISGSNSEEEQEFEIIYETPAPAAEEEIIENGKRIIITGPDDVHYKNILSFTELTKELTKQELDKFELYQIKDNQRIKTQFTAYDTNENGLYDDIEWITPELSEAEFLLIIEISKAEHLDENRENGVDIYESVKELDGNWSETINENEYVRVTFEQKLDNTRDITIYARAVNYLNNSGECYDDETEILTREEVDCDEVNCNDENVYCEEIISYNEIENKEKDANNVASKAMQILTDYNNSNNNRYLNVSDNKKNKGVNLTPTVKNYSLDNNNYEAINYINFSVDNNLAEEAELILTVRNRSEKSGLFPRHPGSTPGLGASALSKKCYKEEWKYFYELTGKEEVMTLNSETGEKEWQIPVEKQAYDNGNNDMYKIVLEDENGEESELLVSEKHKVYAGENYLDNNKLLSPIKVNPTNFPDSDCLAIIPEPKSKLSAFSGFPNEMYNTSAFSSYSNDILSDFSINSSILFSCLSIYLNKKQLAQNPQFEMILYMQLLDAYCLSQESCQTSLLQEENLHLLAEQDLACLEPLLSRSLCLASQDEPCKYVSSVPLSTLLEHCLLKMQHASFGYYNFDGYKKLSMADFSLQKITDVYKDINENNKEIYFLDSENKPIKVKSITKQAYNGKIYDVDVKNDIVLVRRNNVVCETEEQTKEITNLNLNTDDYINNKDANNINKLNDNNKIEEVSEKKSKSSLDNNELVNNKLINNENKCRVIEGKAVWSGNSNPVSIEVYEKDGNDLIAKFENIIEGENKIYLTNLENEQDVFDLKVVDGSLEIDWIVDPIISEQQAVTDSILINVTAETNFTHLNISSTAPFDSLVGYWNFDGDQENGVNFSDNSTANRFTVYDFSKNNRDGFSVIRPYVNSTNCIYGDCVKFDGNSSVGWRSYIDLVNKWSFIGNQSLTIMMWAYPYGSQTSSGDARMIQSGSDCLLRYVNNRAEFILNLFNDPNDRVNSPANTFPVNTWTHLVGMYNNATNNLSLWVNGVVVNSTAPTGNFGTCSLWTLGGSKAVSGGYNGSIDEVMVFNDALTAAQILAIYNNQSARFATQGTQDIVNQSYMNISTGNNRVNVTTYIENLLGSSINLSVGYYDGSWSYTTPQVVSSGVVQIFNITDTSTNLTLNYTFIAGSFTAPFYSPILKSNITFEAWNEGEGVADITPPDINFTFPTPSNASYQIENSIFVNVTANDSQNNISTFIDFDRSLIGWWRMDEYNLTGIFDNSSYNNFGVFTGGLSSADVVDGHLGKGLEFDGIDDYLNTSKQIITSSPFTVSLWIKSAETQDSLSVPISQGHSNIDGVVLQFYSWNAPYLCVGGFADNPYCIEDYPNTDTNWKHVILVANDSGICKVYVDGQLSQVNYTYDLGSGNPGYLPSVDSWACNFVPADYKLIMGTDYNYLERYFNGSIDDVMIFNRSLSANEIAAIYANQTFRYLGVNFTNLTGGSHKFKAYAQDTAGNVNSTEEREVNILGVTSCGVVLNKENTVYTLENNIINNDLQTNCINITAKNVTLDCKGYYIKSDDPYTGIYSNALNTTIKNCNITMSSASGGIGIYLDGANSSYVFNNSLDGQQMGLYLFSVSGSLIVDNTANYNTLRGMTLYYSTDNNLVNNTANLNTYNGIQITFGSNNSLSDNTFKSNGNEAIWLWETKLNYIKNSKIWNATTGSGTTGAIFVFVSSNNTFEGGYINMSKNYGIYLYSQWADVNNNLFKDIWIENTSNYSVYLKDFVGAGYRTLNNTFLNVSYNITKEYVEAGSELIRKWYYQAKVNDSNGINIANANVTVYNVSGKYQFNLTTGAGGLTPIVEIVDYINYGGTRSYYSDYTTYADNETLFASHKLNVTAESLKNNFGGLVFEVFTLVEIDTTPPDINFTFPTPSNGTSTYNTSIEINVSIVEENLDEVKFNWEEVNATIYDNSTVLFMNFDNRSSLGENDTRIADLSGNGNNGTVINATVNTADCRYGNCFSFDGNGDYINTGDIDAFDNEITISAWIKPAGLQSSYVKIISKRNSADSSYVYSLQYDDSQRLNFNLNDSNVSISTTQIFSSPQWYHIVATYNGSKAKIYINNEVDGIKDGITTIPGSIYNTIIGAYKGNSVGNYFNGTIDEIRIWNRSLSVGEIKQLYFTNLQKFNQTQWYLYVNQNKDSTNGLEEGIYTYFASAKDKAGNENQTEVREVTINIDNTNPDINFTAPTPSNASFQSGNSIFVNVTANDSENNISTFVDFDNSLALWMRFDDKLIRNGDAETNTTDNWNGSTSGPFDNVSSEDCYSGNYCFYEEGAKTIWSEDFIPINTSKSYYLEGMFKAVGTGNEKLYFGYVPYDENKVQIQSNHVNIIADTETVLCTNINAGDKSILIKNATNWEIFLGTNVSYDYVAFNTATDFSDLPNRDLSNRNITNKTKYANCPVDTLACPSSGECWNITFDTSVGKSYPLGTPIREHKSGSSYMYSAAGGVTVPMEWIKYSGTTKGEFLYGLGSTKWWHGTKYARILLLMNWGSGSNTENKTKVDDISLKGGTIADFERENYGFVYGDASLSEGYFGKGFSFDGVDDYVDFNTLNSQGNKTLSFWFRTLDIGQGSKVLVYYVSDINDYLICGLINNAISCSSQTSSKQTPAISSQWHHIAVIKNSSSILSIYLDGVKSLVSGTTFYDFGNDFLLGKQGTQTSYNFNGTIDDVIIFNRTLSNEEIVALYANTSSRYLGIDFTNLFGGSHKFKAYAQDTFGNLNWTEERIVNTQSLSIGSCSVLNVANAVYTQTADIDQQLTEDCIIIVAQNITYDCNGYSITSLQSSVSGVYSNQYNTTIKNCNIDMGSSGYGINLRGANYSYVFNSTLNNQQYGLYLDKTYNTVIEMVTASLNTGTGAGVYLSSSSNNNLKNITASSNGYGIFLSSSSNNILTNINASSNTVIAGISLSSSSNNTLTNIVTNNNPSGVYTTNSKNNILTNITANSNDYQGISLSSSSNNILTNINANLNTGTGAGVYLSSSSNNNLKNITASSNGYGISLSSSSNNTLTNINASLNGYTAGIYFTSGSSNSTLTNIITNNNPTGIYITTNSERNILTNITANSNTDRGVYIAGVGTNNNILTNITANSNNYGIALSSSSNNTLTDNTANSNLQYGIYLSTSSNNTLMDNNIWNCTSTDYDCLYLENSDGNTILGGIINKSNNSLIYLSNSKNNLFKNLQLYNSTNDSVYVGNSVNNTFDGLLIYSPDTAKAGIYSNSLNTTIKNSNITMKKASGGRGVYLQGANSSYVFNNSLNGQYDGLYLYFTFNTKIENNSANNNSYGIRIQSSQNNILINNIVDNINNGIRIQSSQNNILINNIANNNINGIRFTPNSNNNTLINNTANNNSLEGFLIDSSSNNILISNTVNNNTKNGIYLWSSSNNNILINNIVNNNADNGILFNVSSNNTIRDSNVLFNLKNDTFLASNLTSNSTNNIFINVTYNASKEYVEAGSQLIRKWYYQAYVNDTDGIDVSGANVTAYNRTNSYQFNLTTNSSGYTNITEIIDYVNYGGARSYYSDYIIEATNESLFEYHKLNVTNKSLTPGFSGLIFDVITLEKEIKIWNCRELNRANTIYIQTADIVQTSNANCIVISAQNITYNGNGYSITSIYNKSGVYSNQYNTTVKNCNISMGSGFDGSGIELNGADNSFIYNNTLNSQYREILFRNDADNNTITNNDIWDCSFACVYIDMSNSNVFDSNKINKSSGYGIFIDAVDTYTSNNNVFKNTNMTNIEGTSVNIGNANDSPAVNNTFLNFSYFNESVNPAGELIRKWYYQAYVNDTNGNNVGNANVSFYNKSNFLVGRFKTNSSGWINRTEIIDYVNLGGVRNFYSPYTITAVNKSSVGYRRDYNVTLLQNKLNNFITIDVVNPNINFTWPTSSGKIYNKLIFVNVSANDFSSNISTFIDFDNSLVGWWRMDDLNSSGGVIDYTGKNNGTAVGNATQTDAGKMGKGFYIPGSGNCIKTSFNGTEYSELTISAWVKTDILNDTRYIVDNSPVVSGEYSKGYGLRMNGDNLEFFAKSINGSGLVSKEDILTVGQWYHVVAVHNTTDNYLYVNAGYPNKTSYNSSTGINASNSLMSIGSAEASCSYGWDGIIDDVMIFNRSLSAEEIRALYANTSSRYLGVNFPNLEYKNYTFRAYAQDEAGNVNLTEKINVSIINVPPVVIYVQYNKSITPNSGGIVNVSINFTVYDRNDYTNLNDSSARANFSLIGYEQSRVNLSCSRINSESLKNYANYSCTIGMWYYDKGGAWNISVSIEDLDGNWAVNNSNNFSYEILYSWDMVPNYVNWSNIEIGQSTDKPADNNMTIRNLGNVNIINASVNATNLNGTGAYPQDQIPANNFSFSNSSSDACLGAKLKENQNVSVNLFINYSKSINYSYANSTLGFCLKGLPAGIPAQEYETETNKPWNIDIVFGFFISVKYALLVVAVAVRKKKKLKKILTSENLLEIFDERLKEKYNIGVEELLKIKEEKIEKEKPEEVFKEEIQIPLVIFKQQISPAEALCKYLKENLGLKFREIAKLLNRDERTVWINYRNAVKKKKEKIKIEEYKEKIEETKKFEKRKEIYLPVKIFANRKLSILENIVSYLKEKEMRNKEIAKMLGKDQRNVYTLCSRAKKKLK